MENTLHTFRAYADTGQRRDFPGVETLTVIKPEHSQIPLTCNISAQTFFDLPGKYPRFRVLPVKSPHETGGDVLVQRGEHPHPSLFAQLTAKVIVDHVGGNDLEQAVDAVLMRLIQASEGLVVIGTKLQIGGLDQIVDQRLVRPGTAAHGFGHYPGNHRLKSGYELTPARLL